LALKATPTSAAALCFPVGGGDSQLTAIPTKTLWPYVQQWHLDIQRELARNTLVTIAYVGAKGTHLSKQLDENQLHSTPASQNPFPAGTPITDPICQADQMPNGTVFTGQALLNLTIACGYGGNLAGSLAQLDNGNVDPDLVRPLPRIRFHLRHEQHRQLELQRPAGFRQTQRGRARIDPRLHLQSFDRRRIGPLRQRHSSTPTIPPPTAPARVMTSGKS
jgi:hypothetical protein